GGCSAGSLRSRASRLFGRRPSAWSRFLSSLPLELSPGSYANSTLRAAGDRRHDAHGVAFAQLRRILLQVANVFVVYVDVDEAAQTAVIGVEVLLELGIPARQGSKRLTYRRGLQFNDFLLAGIGSKRRRDDDFHWHPCLLCELSGRTQRRDCFDEL